MAQMAQILGGTLGSYIILHLILLAYRETKHRVRSILQASTACGRSCKPEHSRWWQPR